MAKFRTSLAFDIVFIIALAVFLGWATVNRVAVGDWIYFLTYDPSSEVTALATDAGLSPYGQRLLYRTDPTLADKSTVDAECDIEDLGCINSKGRVFILDQPGQHNRAVVTAAHEMLHLAYRRLSDERKAELAPLIDQAIAQNSPDITSELQGETDSADRRDEAHSLLGSEYQHLPAELEQYYAQYFTDRSKVVAAETAAEKQN